MSKNVKKEIKQRDFKGVWIPKEIYLNEELNWTEKILLIEIDSLDNEKGCFASNEYFANFIGKSKVYISNCISKLKDKNYIYQESFDGRKRVLRSNYAFGVRDKAALNNSLRQHKDIVKGSPNEKFKGGKSKNPDTSRGEGQKNSPNNTLNNRTNNLVSKEEEEGDLSTSNLSTKTKELFEQVFNQKMQPYHLNSIKDYSISEQLLRKAIEVSGKYNAQSFQYTIDLLKDWYKKGITTPEEFERFKRAYKDEENEEDLKRKGYR